MRSKKKYMVLSVILIIFSIFTLGGCSNKTKELKIFGGDIIRYSLCIEDNKSTIVSCPIITTKKVNNISLNSFKSNQKEEISITVNGFEKDSMVQYGNYYIYFVILNLSCKRNDTLIDAKINQLNFDIDGKTIEYKTPYFNVKNTLYFMQKNSLLQDDKCLKISGDYTGIYGYVPDKQRKANLCLTSDKDITIKSYQVLDYLKVNDFTLHDSNDKLENCKSDQLNKMLKKDGDMLFDYTISLMDNVSDLNIIRSSQIIIYNYDGRDFIWVYTPGIYIWKDYSDYGNIKKYIDEQSSSLDDERG